MTTSAIDKALSAPPLVVAGATVFGYSLPEIASAVTIVYTLLLIYFRVRKEVRLRRAGPTAQGGGDGAV